jgi:hypothetical protein
LASIVSMYSLHVIFLSQIIPRYFTLFILLISLIIFRHFRVC